MAMALPGTVLAPPELYTAKHTSQLQRKPRVNASWKFRCAFLHATLIAKSVQYGSLMGSSSAL